MTTTTTKTISTTPIMTTTTTKTTSTTPITRPLQPLKITRSSSGPSTGSTQSAPIVRPTFVNTLAPLAPPSYGLPPDQYFVSEVLKTRPKLSGIALADASRAYFNKLKKK